MTEGVDVAAAAANGDLADAARGVPTGRFGTVEEVASLAMYLLSKEADQIIGHTIMIDGAYDIK